MELLTRDAFRESVFKRDNHKCVNCKAPGQDAHHILERRLWGEDGGYYLNNGATVCGPCHIKCEQTLLTVEEIREKAGITKPIIPAHFYRDIRYDKWGNVYQENGRRTPGELFYDESVQKILKPVLDQFDAYVKYPRTYHLPWSPGLTRDDRVITTDIFKNKPVVVTIKMDGENTTLYHDYIHARSLNSSPHPSRTWIKNFHANIAMDIPPGYRMCGENLYAKHSIAYDNLPSYFMCFSIWNQNQCLSWAETCEYAELLGVTMVPVVWEGIYDEAIIRKIGESITNNNNNDEGYVIRLQDSFEYKDFRTSIAKYVRKGHVETTHNWMAQTIVPNKLKIL